jgi:exodeoxyribonuclease V alpha subunit
MVKTRIPSKFQFDPIRDIQVLCPMNRGSLGIRELNLSLQTELNPARTEEPMVEKFGWLFHLRDKVIQTENNYDARREVVPLLVHYENVSPFSAI